MYCYLSEIIWTATGPTKFRKHMWNYMKSCIEYKYNEYEQVYPSRFIFRYYNYKLSFTL